ncbi:MAG: polymer-forming cytoskeletal protein [Bacteroidetes bacterium]|nr:polymer-forming cytoskeletal protein [Bacteroidota bacterium]MCY4204880.1 polymer-forming cytoskeletal protein [Bacteroidota bacterium]
MLNPSNKKKSRTPQISHSSKESGEAFDLNILADGTKIKGSFISPSDTRICGILEGELKVEGTIFLTDGGFVDGNINANIVNIAGSVKGDIIGTKKVFLTETAKVEGTIRAERLVVEEGAIFNGTCHMAEKSKTHTPKLVPATNGKTKQLAKKSA